MGREVMAKFYVGQRVRAVGKWVGDPHRDATGMELVIVGVGGFRGKASGRFYEYCAARPDYGTVVGDAHDFEPLTPEGWQRVAWEDCLWQPDGVAA
jgi:hypothetical protein